jgi:glycosyltransferase involved in cell wall biosynthesis
LDLLLDGIIFAARMRPSQKFEWIHFGDGKARATLQVRLDKEFPPNATGKLPGFVSNPEILQYYRATPVDVFVNLSTTEGGAPVSIMEAIACGIPIVATRVGGNPEIVSERNGILLNPDPTPEQVARALLTIWGDPETAWLMRVESRRIWQESYNANVNFRDFAEQLKSLVKGK